MKWIHRMLSVTALYATTLIYLVSRIQHNDKSSTDSFPLQDCAESLTEKQKVEEVIKTTLADEEDVHITVLPRKQFGPGINGSEVVMDVSEISPEDLPQYRDDFARDDFNGYLSDIISMHRIVDDYRPDMSGGREEVGMLVRLSSRSSRKSSCRVDLRSCRSRECAFNPAWSGFFGELM
ncbi:uncharacterized protein LOC132735267 [Ruditapes philippinarum]|uniref:uncharacterized protein LOC132735267 n=1 Tax=Ruditapes philippinarum TaxID=129788 RepID=UPI00295B3DA4|nr:uncharacterized protein LOC132735267 [Ruditapes philippinarum]